MNTISVVMVVVTFVLMGLLWMTMNKKDPPRHRRAIGADPPRGPQQARRRDA
jgi:hypothetical protein